MIVQVFISNKEKNIVCVLCALKLTNFESTGSKEAKEKQEEKLPLQKISLISFNYKRINKSKKTKPKIKQTLIKYH